MVCTIAVMITRPLLALATGGAALGAALLDIHLKRRSNMSDKIFAETTRTAPNKLLTTSRRLHELAKFVGTDEISPDVISNVIRELTADLLANSLKTGVALDWHSYRVIVFDQYAEGVSQIIVRVDVLS